MESGKILGAYSISVCGTIKITEESRKTKHTLGLVPRNTVFLSRSSTSFCFIRLTTSMSCASATYRRLEGDVASAACEWDACLGVLEGTALVPPRRGGEPGGVVDSIQKQKQSHRPTLSHTGDIGRHTYHTPTVLSVPNLRFSLPTIPQHSSAPSHSQIRQSNRFHELVACTRHQAHRGATKRDRRLRGCIHRRQTMGWRRLVWCSASGMISGG